MSTALPDVPEFIGTTENYTDLYVALKLRQRGLLRSQLRQFSTNLAEYVQKRAPIKKDAQTVVFSKILEDARFIPAHASRYVAGFDLNAVTYCVLHRPSTEPKASTLENLIITFAQYDAAKAAVSGGVCPSTHFGVGQQGELVQFVDLADRTFHVAVGNYNQTSIGVEIEGAVGTPLSVACYTTLAKLLLQLRILCPNLVLDDKHVVEHRVLEPRRKLDVGTPFSFDILKEYIDRFAASITSVSFVSYTAEEVSKSFGDTIVELSAFGNALAGAGKLEHKELIDMLNAQQKHDEIILAERKDLAQQTIASALDKQYRITRTAAQHARVNGAPLKPVAIHNGAGVELT